MSSTCSNGREGGPRRACGWPGGCSQPNAAAVRADRPGEPSGRTVCGPASVTEPPLPSCLGHGRLQVRPRNLRNCYFAAVFVFETFDIAIPLLSLNGQHRIDEEAEGEKTSTLFGGRRQRGRVNPRNAVCILKRTMRDTLRLLSSSSSSSSSSSRRLRLWWHFLPQNIPALL